MEWKAYSRTELLARSATNANGKTGHTTFQFFKFADVDRNHAIPQAFDKCPGLGCAGGH